MSETEVNEGGNGGNGAGGIKLAEIMAYFIPRSTIKIHSFQFLPGIVEFIARIALMVSHVYNYNYNNNALNSSILYTYMHMSIIYHLFRIIFSMWC